MGYTIIEDFSAGLDARRIPIAVKPGSMTLCENCHVTQGGDVESRKAFVPTYSLPAGTIGLASGGGTHYVFGSGPEPSGIPAGVSYQRLQHPVAPSEALIEIISCDFFNSVPYVVARFDSGSVIHFYNGTYVSDFSQIQQVVTGNSTVYQRLADQIEEGGLFTVTFPGGVMNITTPGGTDEFGVNCGINLNGSESTGSTLGLTDYVPGVGPFTVTSADITIGGSFNPRATYYVILYHVNTGTQIMAQVTGLLTIYRSVVATHRSKMYATAGALLYFSALQNPFAWYLTPEGEYEDERGFVNVGNQTRNPGEITAIVAHNGKTAVFMRNSIQLWNLSEKQAANAFLQSLNETGTIAPNSCIEVAGLDTFYLSDSGIRSLRAREIADGAFISDAGAAIDPLVRDHMLSLSYGAVQSARAILEPTDGRLWMALGDRIYVLSRFPDNRISAWSIYYPGFTVEGMSVLNGRAWVRAGDVIYCYGGLDGDVYPAPNTVQNRVRMPFHHFGKPGHLKSNLAFDIAGLGSWDVRLLTNYNDPGDYSTVGTLSGSTYNVGRINTPRNATHIALEFGSAAGGRNLLAQVVFHYTIDGEK